MKITNIFNSEDFNNEDNKYDNRYLLKGEEIKFDKITINNSSTDTYNVFESLNPSLGFNKFSYIKIGKGLGTNQALNIGFRHLFNTNENENEAVFGFNNNSTIFKIKGTGYTTRYNNSSTWDTVSDSRIKENIKDCDLEKCYNNIRKLKLRNFTYKPETNLTDKEQMGLIAQELENIIPDAIHTSSDYGIDDLKNVNYDKIYLNMLGALKYLISKFD
jgi:hypothetical protein